MQEFFYNGVQRLDWGFGNPNITAGLIATLLMAVWGLAFIHRWGFWPALVGFTALGVCLLQTASRGGLVAAILGGVVLVACLRRPWPRGRWIPVVVALVLLGSYAVWHGVATRYGKGIVEEDASVSNRWLIYRTAPAMMVDAPGGWGHNRAVEAFHHFYQPVGRFERYDSLVSSHLTWMVEMSWLERFGYVALWFAILAICIPTSKREWYAVVLAVWLAFGAAGMFTTMLNRSMLWVIPGSLLFGLSGARVVLHDWPSRGRCIGLIAGGSLATLSAVFFCGSIWMPSKPSINLRLGWVHCVGQARKSNGIAETIWIAAPDPAVLGGAYGQRVREWLSQNGSSAGAVFIDWCLGELTPGPSDTVVLSGEGVARFASATSRARRWVFLNPELPPETLNETLTHSPQTYILWGELNPSRARYFWSAFAQKFNQVTFEDVKSAGEYLPNWFESLPK